MVEKKKPTSFKMSGLDNRSWDQAFHWRWAIVVLVVIIPLAFVFYSRIDQESNLGEIDFLQIIFAGILILPAFGIFSFGLLLTRSEQSRTVHLYNLQCELSRELVNVKGWDEAAATLFRFITNQLPLTGLSLLVYNQTSEKYEIVAERLSGGDIESSVHCLPLIRGGKQIALVNLYLVPDVSYTPAQKELIQSLAPEVAIAIERIDLFRSLTESTLAVQKKEQYRIARYLHDTIGDDLAYLCMKLDQLSSTSGQMNGLVRFHSEVASMYNIANNAVDHIRNLLTELQDDYHAIPSPDLVSNVTECALLIGARANFHVNIQNSGDPKILTPQMHRQILYLVREILRNVEKHAHAQNVTLTINWLDTGLTIKISDDGQGFDVNMPQKNEGHYGLRTLREIVCELNGSLSVVSNPGEGTQISIYLPG